MKEFIAAMVADPEVNTKKGLHMVEPNPEKLILSPSER